MRYTKNCCDLRIFRKRYRHKSLPKEKRATAINKGIKRFKKICARARE